MSKEELQNKLKKLSDEYSSVKAELTKIQQDEELVEQVKRFGEFKFKACSYYGLSDNLSEVTAADLKIAKWSNGLPLIRYGGRDEAEYILLRNAEEHAFYKKLFTVMDLVHDIRSPCGGDQESIEFGKREKIQKLYSLLK